MATGGDNRSGLSQSFSPNMALNEGLRSHRGAESFVPGTCNMLRRDGLMLTAALGYLDKRLDATRCACTLTSRVFLVLIWNSRASEGRVEDIKASHNQS